MIRVTPFTPPEIRSNIKFCKECRHVRSMASTSLYKHEAGCGLFKKVDLVTGVPEFDLAMVARGDTDACGPSARFFEAREMHHQNNNMRGHFSKETEKRSIVAAPSPSSAYSSNETK